MYWTCHVNKSSPVASFDSKIFHLCNITCLRLLLNINDAETMVHAFITSRLDRCNSLFYGLPNTTINKLQYIQNWDSHLFKEIFSHYSHFTHFIGYPFVFVFNTRYSSSLSKHFVVLSSCKFIISFYLLFNSHIKIFWYWSVVDSTAQVSIVWWTGVLYLCPHTTPTIKHIFSFLVSLISDCMMWFTLCILCSSKLIFCMLSCLFCIILQFLFL